MILFWGLFVLFASLGAPAPAVLMFLLAVVSTPGLNVLARDLLVLVGAIALALIGVRAWREHDRRTMTVAPARAALSPAPQRPQYTPRSSHPAWMSDHLTEPVRPAPRRPAPVQRPSPVKRTTGTGHLAPRPGSTPQRVQRPSRAEQWAGDVGADDYLFTHNYAPTLIDLDTENWT